MGRRKGDKMNYGRLTEHIYKRSVDKVVRDVSQNNMSFYDGAALGADCAILPSGLLSARASASGRDDSVAARALFAASNNAWAASRGEVNDTYAVLNVKVPGRWREIKVRRIMEQAAHGAERLGIPIMCADVSVLPCVSEPIAECVVSGRANQGSMCKVTAGDDIVMTKWIGLEGTSLIAGGSFDALRERYPADMITEAEEFLRHFSVAAEAMAAVEAATAVKSGACYMKAAREGGIFGALWELASDNGVGLVADLKDIPVRQETIEICEFFDLNPYELLAGGSLLIVTTRGADLAKRLNEMGINAAVIGKICEGNDRIVRNGEETRFLEPAKGDEIFRYYEIVNNVR